MTIKNLPINRQIIFSNHKNEHTKKVEKRQTKLLTNIDFIKPFLKSNEKILLITTGCSPTSFMEHFLGGLPVLMLKRCIFIFTNTRLFHIPTTINYTYRNSIAHMIYSDCASISLKGRKLVVEHTNGTTESFPYIAGKEKKKVLSFLDILPLAMSEDPSGKRIHLCPRCTEELDTIHDTCRNCSLKFKNKEKAKLFSILLPGGGYFYTRHPFFGIGNAFTEIILILFVVACIPGLFSETGEDGILSFFLILLILIKVITVYHSNHFIKEYIPVDKEVRIFDHLKRSEA